MFNPKVIPLLLLNVALQLSCENRDIEVPQDYYPVNPASVRYYEVEHYQPYKPGGAVTDTISVQYDGDTLIAGKTYLVEAQVWSYTLNDGTRVAEKNIFRLTRNEGNRWYYLSPGTEGPEFLFVDGNASVGDVHVTYQNTMGRYKIEHTVVAKDTRHTIHGVHYTGVIEIEEVGYWRNNSTGNFIKSHMQRRWFAPGVGEIYSALETYVYTIGMRNFLLPLH